MSADSPRRSGDNIRQLRGAIVAPQVVSDRSILDSAIGFINEVTLAHPVQGDSKNTIAWARFETAADISDPRFGEDWEARGNVAPPLLLILGYNVGAQVWAIPSSGEAVEVLSWRHGLVTSLRMLPTPSPLTTVDEHERADEPLDAFADQRPLVALVESSSTSGSPPQFCTVNFVSLKTGTQVKTLKYKNTIVDILVNRSSIVITFHECLIILDANTLVDRWSINTCYPSPGINPNPVALGDRWLAYAQHTLINCKRSGGGWDGEALASYTSTVLNAAKTLGKGLRDLGGQVAAGLTGSSSSGAKNNFSDPQLSGDNKQAGVVTIIDTMEKRQALQYDSTGSNTNNSSSSNTSCSDAEADGPTKIVHFVAHSEPIAAIEFDYSGMLLLTADRRGHDFHVFRIQPHPLSSALAGVHHLYVLHRGDTSAKVQNISFSMDSRWVAVSTLRGTTHVFPIAPYGGIIGARSHGSYRVVNQMSNYLRSAGLPADERSDSPVAHSESTHPYPNRTTPPFPRPLVISPLAQLRQPFALDSPPRSANPSSSNSSSGSQRQRLSSLSDDNGKPLSVCAIFAESRSWLLDPPKEDEPCQRNQRKALDSLFVMAGHGSLIQYDLDTKLPANVSKEWNDAPIELIVEAKAQWNLAQRKEGSQEVIPPLSPDNLLLRNHDIICMPQSSLPGHNNDAESSSEDESEERREPWLSQVERTTYMGPGRRLWMGPQFSFWTYEEPNGCNSGESKYDPDNDVVDIEKCEVKPTTATAALTALGPLVKGCSSPLNMTGNRASPLQITACSWSSLEPSPKLERLRHDSDSSASETSAFIRNNARIKAEMAEAMREASSTLQGVKDSGHCLSKESTACTAAASDNAPFYDALADNEDTDDNDYVAAHKASAAALASALPNIHSYKTRTTYNEPSQPPPLVSIEQIVNTLGMVTTVTSCLNNPIKTDMLDEVVSQLAAEKPTIHENYDERLFRPVVTVFYDEKTPRNVAREKAYKMQDVCKPSELITNKLIVPVIAKELDEQLNKREKQKRKCSKMLPKEKVSSREQSKFEELSSCNKKALQSLKGSMRKDKKEHVSERTQLKMVEKVASLEKKESKKDTLEEDVLVKNVIQKKDNSNENFAPAKEKFAHQTEKSEYEIDTNTLLHLVESKPEPITSVATEPTVRDKTTAMPIEQSQKPSESINILPVTSEHFNVMDLADSLIEIKEDKEFENPLISETAQPLEPPVDIYTQSTKSSKRNNKRKGFNFSASSSETEEFVDIKSLARVEECNLTKPRSNIQLESFTQMKNDEIKQNQETHMKNVTEEVINSGAETGDNNTYSKKRNKQNIKENTNIGNKKQPEEKQQIPEAKSGWPETKGVEAEKDKTLKSNNDGKSTPPDTICKNKVIKKTCSVAMEEFETQNDECEQWLSKNIDKVIDKVENAREDNKVKSSSVQVNKNTIKPKINQNKKSKSDTECQQSDLSVKSLHREENVLYRVTVKNVMAEKTDEKSVSKNNSESDISTEERETRSSDESTKYLKNVGTTAKKLKSKENKGSKNQKEVELRKEAKNKDNLPDNGTSLKEKRSQNNVKLNQTTINVRSFKEDKQRDIFINTVSNKTDEVDSSLSNKNEMETDKANEERSDKRQISATDIEQSTDKYKKPLANLKETNPPGNGNSIQKIKNNENKILSGKSFSSDEMFNRDLNKIDNTNCRSLSVASKLSKCSKADKLLPELPPLAYSLKEIASPKKTQQTLSEVVKFSNLEPIEPLRAVRPLDLLATEAKVPALKEISLINFESPLQEEEEVPIAVEYTTPTQHFTEHNLINVMCGSLHYENEQQDRASSEKHDLESPTQSTVALEGSSIVDYKTLTESEEPFISLDKYSSSPNSSVSECEKKSKKQKRKKQLEQHKKSEKSDRHRLMDDEELRPLIAMPESEIEQEAKNNALLNESYTTLKPLMTLQSLGQSTTDSEGPMLTTTSDDNIVALPASHKIKTKKLEHKINLIAAIEAATSSSTSSAEESGLEIGRRSPDNGDFLIPISNAATIGTILPTSPITTAAVTQSGVTKKKTKRRRR